MPVSAKTLAALMAAGVTGEKLVEIVALIDADMDGEKDSAAEKRRAYDRDRKRREREARVSTGHSGGNSGGTEVAMSGGNPPEIPPETASPRARGLDNPLRLVTSGEVVVDAVERASDDWPKGDARRQANLIVELVGSPWLDPMKSPGLVTTVGRFQAWKTAGASWEHDVVPVITGLCANRRGQISTWKFFDAAIAKSIADNRAALEIPEAGRRGPGRNETAEPRSVEQWTFSTWRAALDLHRETGQWGANLGGRPGEPNCRAPPELLVEFGHRNAG